MLRHAFSVVLFPLALLVLVSTDAGACCTQRTFVASTGSDANSCTAAAPCRSFSAALGQTESHGEIIVLDSAGYGPVTIPNPISITAPPGIYAGITVISGDGVTIVTGTSSKVVLRGLTINGEGGQNGINFISGQGLQIHDCVVSDMASNGIQLGATGSTVLITGTLIRQSLQSGIYLEGTQVAVLDGVRAEGNRYGVYARSGPAVTIRNTVVVNSFSGGGFNLEASDADSRMTISNSVSSGNSGDGVVATESGGFAARVTADHLLLQDNAGTGIKVIGEPSMIAILTGNIITHNVVGISIQMSAQVFTRNDNTVVDNSFSDITGGPMTPLTAL